jgi:hypothetical protein
MESIAPAAPAGRTRAGTGAGAWTAIGERAGARRTQAAGVSGVEGGPLDGAGYDSERGRSDVAPSASRRLPEDPVAGYATSSTGQASPSYFTVTPFSWQAAHRP